jgi:signal transduction histidine kinase
MNYHALAATITSILFLFFGTFIFLKTKKNAITVTYLIFCLTIFWWLVNFSFMYWSKDPQTAYIFAKVAFIGVLPIPIAMLHFVTTFLGLGYKYNKYIKLLYIFNIPVLIVHYCSGLIYSGIKVCFWGYYPVAGSLYFIILTQFCFLFLVAVYLLLKNLYNRDFSAIKQQQVKYLSVAFITLSLGLGDYLTKFKTIEIYPFGYVLILIFVITIAISIINYNLMDIRVALTKTGLIIVIYTFVLGIPFYIGLRAGRWFVASIILFLLSTLGPIFFRYLQRKAEKILLSEQEKYQQFLVHASKGMVEQHDLGKLSNLIVRMIKKAVKIQFVSLFVYDEHRNVYFNIANRGFENGLSSIQYTKENKIIKYMVKAKQPIMFVSLKEDLKKEIIPLAEGINLIVPSILRDELVAFLILGDKTNKSIYSSQDIEVFKTLSNQAGLAIENCNFLEKSKKQQERLFEAEKLASIGGMADGMAHQIKNRLHQFAMVGGELRMEVENFENDYKPFVSHEPKVEEMVRYLKEIADSIGVNVKKTNGVLQGILNFAKTTEKDTYFSYFSFKEIIEQSVGLIKVKHQREEIPLIIEVPEDDRLYGVKSQIQEVIFNCIDNSFEAILEKEDHLKKNLLYDFKDDKINKNFVPEIKITLQYVNKNARIYIKDNGIGIKAENQAKIFSAFFTTKPSSRSGSGIGSYVIKRMIVENHKGDISFRSQYGVGTTFVINLPMSKNISELEVVNN